MFSIIADIFLERVCVRNIGEVGGVIWPVAVILALGGCTVMTSCRTAADLPGLESGDLAIGEDSGVEPIRGRLR